LKRTGDKCEHKKEMENIETYADYFQRKVPNTPIAKDCLMGTMKPFKRPRRNYLTDSMSKKDKESTIPSNRPPDYYPIELLRYYSLNQTDIQLIYKLPSILVRVQQLFYIEQLRILLANNLQSYPVLQTHSKILKTNSFYFSFMMLIKCQLLLSMIVLQSYLYQ